MTGLEFAGLHHLKLPVSDLPQSIEWYRTRLGYRVVMEFIEKGLLVGVSMAHSAGGPPLALRLNPQMARAAAGFDYFAIATRDEASTIAAAEHFTSLNEHHQGVHFTGRGWILPGLHDPDGHEIRIYSWFPMDEPADGEAPLVAHDPKENARQVHPAG